jgi:hypothetical protein
MDKFFHVSESSYLQCLSVSLEQCLYCSLCLHVTVPHAATARILISMNLVGQVVFLFVADYLHCRYSTVTVEFAFCYLAVTLLQVGV